MSSGAFQWANSTYLNLELNAPVNWQSHTLVLTAATTAGASLRVDDHTLTLPLSRNTPATICGNLRLFCADTRAAASLTTDTFTRSRRIHGCLQSEALIGISPAPQPMLPPERFCFPIVGTDAPYVWHMRESSHMFAYMAPDRSHEGIDMDLTSSEATTHLAVAIEAATVVRLQRSRNGCAILQSQHDPHIYYTYHHLDGPALAMDLGDELKRGQPLGPPSGDGRWPHLHLSVCLGEPSAPPSLNHRFDNLVNAFPQFCELAGYAGNRPHKLFEQIDWILATSDYWTIGNAQKHGTYNPHLGYGWELGPWCKPACVELAWDTSRRDATEAITGVRLRACLFEGTAAESHAPHDTLTFRIDMTPGDYIISVTCGDPDEPTSQALTANGTHLGRLDLLAGQHASTPPTHIHAPDGTIRLSTTLPATLTHINVGPLLRSGPEQLRHNQNTPA